MPFLYAMSPPPVPKLFIGYSDVTALHIFLNQQWKWPTLHFPVLTHLKQASPQTIKHFKRMVESPATPDHASVFNNLKLWNPKQIFNKRGKTKTLSAFLTGGNMTLIQSSIGTMWAGHFQNRFLFLEDTGESPYRLDRSLWHIQNAGVLRGAKAVLLGDFIPPRSQDRSAMKEVLRSFALKVSCPVIGTLPCGHGSQETWPLPFRTKGTLKLHYLTNKAQLHIESPFHHKIK